MSNAIPTFWPAEVVSYDAAKRQCRIKIPGITDGSPELPIAEIAQSLGDMSEKTEIEILPGDRVWIMFAQGDPRFPVITWYRAKNVGNRLDWRRWHHKNMELLFDEVWQAQGPNGFVRMTGGGNKIIANAAQEVEVTAGSKINATVGSAKIEMTDGQIRFSVGGSSLTIDGSSITTKAGVIYLN